jgi:hypothetical protein
VSEKHPKMNMNKNARFSDIFFWISRMKITRENKEPPKRNKRKIALKLDMTYFLI